MKTTKLDNLVHKVCNFLITRFASEEYEAYVMVSTRLGAYVIEKGMQGNVLSDMGRQGQRMFRENVTHNL